MKTAIILVCLLAAAFAWTDDEYNALSYEESYDGLQRAQVDPSISKFAECLRQLMLEGGELTQGMILDPFEMDHLVTNFEITDMLSIQGGIDALKVVGASSFNITKAKLNLIARKLDFDITLQNLVASGSYDVVGELVNLIKFNGKGAVKLLLENVSVSGYGQIGFKGTKLKLSAFEAVLKVQKFDFKLEGLLNNPEITDLVNAMLNDMIPKLLVEQQKNITKLIDKLAKQIADPFLNEMTLQDLLNMVNGSGAGIC